MYTPFDYSDYGVWGGNPFIPSYNREQRRKYIKEHKHDKEATYCTYCKAKTVSVSDDNGYFCCELCGRIKLITKAIEPDSYTTELTSGYCEVIDD